MEIQHTEVTCAQSPTRSFSEFSRGGAVVLRQTESLRLLQLLPTRTPLGKQIMSTYAPTRVG
jgi:hypothetical protein